MRWFYASAIQLWFIFTSQGSVTTNSDPCSSIVNNFSPGTEILRLSVEDSITVTSYCLCEITTDRPAIYLCLYQPAVHICTPCSSTYYCTTSSCSCSYSDSNIRPACISMDINPICPPAGKDSCQTSTNFTMNVTLKPSNACSVESDDDFVINIILLIGSVYINAVFLNATCNAIPISPLITMTTVLTTTSKSWSTSETAAKNTGMIIGIVVGIGGAVLIIAIVVIIVMLRRHRAKSKTPHAKTSSQTTAAAPNEAIPVSAAYDNATNASTLSYQNIAYDNKKADDSSNAYTEVMEPEPMNDRNCYDNREIGRNAAYSRPMCETGKDRDFHASPSQSDENETTLIENEFYG